MLLSGSLGGDKSALPNAHEQNAVGPGHLGLVSARSGSRRKQPNSSLGSAWSAWRGACLVSAPGQVQPHWARTEVDGQLVARGPWGKGQKSDESPPCRKSPCPFEF